MLLLAKLILRLRGLYFGIRGFREFFKDYPVDEIAYRALRGKEAVYPFGLLASYGSAVLGAGVHRRGCPRFYTLDDILLMPPAFTPLRLKKAAELLREPTFADVNTETLVGGFPASMPVVVGSMGSTDVASKTAIAIAKAAAKAGIPLGIGENVATVRGYSRRITRGHPSFKERLLAYLTNMGKHGGVFIQESVEDAYDELWNRVYSDKDLEQYVEEGRIGFEIKVGQGAKPGLGGVIKIPKEQAEKLRRKYLIDYDGGKYATRYSVPGTFTREILTGAIRFMKTAYPKAKIWIKLGPFRDAAEVIEVASREGADAVVIDGKEGGTGMAPTVALKDLGYPTVVGLKYIKAAREAGVKTSLLIAGRLYNGGHVVKAVALGATAVYMARPFLIAALTKGEEGVSKYIESLKLEIQMAVSALGKYDVRDLAPEDVAAATKELAEMLSIPYIYASPPKPLEAVQQA
ncbi:glutamate synthase (NADPH) GltB2 subunit [Pyrobaculum islandicum DSM 4184]|uniref:Glutamate synthase (NADPH) GltB2 subunit n=1 Tax=Pyrobaculum islandicum (strain DSM 4184 / JCM 9189 / GEO3) TaxID=384616 RepID=A1RQU3_PYRIL|nr:glutamate synthase-related protein [Pyrobaculum islandicum]ABL87325.1 glutamate synthase (NADPH) GltB2 subunit [Pyrobaculum islandicum DSM 4184]